MKLRPNISKELESSTKNSYDLAGAATWRKWIFVVGGHNGNFKEVFRYDPDTDKWEGMADMPTVVDDVLYAAEGYVGGYLSLVEA